MTRIVIEDVDDYVDLLNALSAVAQAFTEQSLYATPQQVFSKAAPPATLPPIREIPSPVHGPAQLVPCPGRGTHERLTDCWLCWSDVMRGAAVETDVLADSWNQALRRLSDGVEEGS